MKAEIKKYKFKEGLPVEFEIIKISDLYRQHKNMLVSPHRADFYHIIWIQQGSPTHFVDFKPLNISPDSIIFVPKDCVNLFDKSIRYDGKIILFTDNFFCKSHSDIQFLQSTILFNDIYEITQIQIKQPASELSNILGEMERELLIPKDDAQYNILRNLLHNFLLQADREKRKHGYKKIKANADLDYLLIFKNLLEKNFKSEKSVGRYAADLGITEKRLNKSTTLILDKTPKQLIDERVLLEAKRLLTFGNKSIKEMAFELGFDEPTYFIKYFRKHTGKTPSEFRENYQE